MKRLVGSDKMLLHICIRRILTGCSYSLLCVRVAGDMVKNDKLATMLQERQLADVRQLNMVRKVFCLHL